MVLGDLVSGVLVDPVPRFSGPASKSTCYGQGVIRIRTRTLVLALVAFVTVPILWIVVVGPMILIRLTPH